MQQNNQSISTNEKYGIIVSLKDTFGFIQLFLTEENFYFSIKDCLTSIVVGDEVCFLVKDTIKGKVGYRVQPTDLSTKVVNENVTGTVTREAETKRGPFGVISLAAEGNENGQESNVPFLYEDIIDKTKKIFKGDTVTFKLFTIPDTTYKRASKVVMTQSRKDKLFKQQIKQLVSTGAVVEQGFVDSLCHDFGFVRKVDGDNKLYFRIDDVLDENKRLAVGSEVSFFIINEKTADQSKKDRAVHISILSPGTITLETTLHSSVLGVVTQEAVINPHEVPGELTLHTPISRTPGSNPIQKVELWGRCLSDGLIAKTGDELEFDVTKYRPENLLFARNVVVKAFRSIGREYGRICRVRENGYGFIRSLPRDVDIYFRTAEVIGVDGKVIKETFVREGLTVTYDVCEEEKSSVSRLRAIRVQVDDNAENTSRVITIKSGMLGVVTRESKKDVPGILKVTSDLAALRTLEKELLHKDLKDAVSSFQNSPYLNEVTLEFLSPSQRLAYHTIIENSFTNISLEKVPHTNRTIDDIKVCSLKLKKLKPQEYANWLRSKNNNSDALDLDVANKSRRNTGNAESHSIDHMDNGHIYFQRIHLDDTNGPATIHSEVTFDLCLDKKFSKLIGKSVKVSDAGVDGDNSKITRYHGVIEVSNQKNGKFGYLRCIETDEKLFWQVTSTVSSTATATTNNVTSSPGLSSASTGSASTPNTPTSSSSNNEVKSLVKTVATTSPGTPDVGSSGLEFKEGTEVSFEIRLRGGHRRGINLQSLPKGSLSKELILEGTCLAVVTDESHVVLVDVSTCPDLVNKYSNLIKTIDTLTKNDKKIIQRGTALPNPSPSKDNKIPTTNGTDNTDSNSSNGKTTGTSDTISTGNVKALYPLLQRVPIAVDSTSSVPSLKVGELVTCQAVVNWVLQRHPLRVCNIKRTTTTTASMTKKKGVVRKAKVPIDDLVFAEVVELRSPGSEQVPMYLCDQRDITGLRDAPLRTGDNVEYLPVGTTGLAVCVALAPINTHSNSNTNTNTNNRVESSSSSSQSAPPVTGHSNNHYRRDRSESTSSVNHTSGGEEHDGIVFKRTVMAAADGKKVVPVAWVVAEGPADNGSIGFTAGWREPPDITGLPWGHLLPPVPVSKNK